MFAAIHSFLYSRLMFLPTILLWILSSLLLFRKWIYRKYNNMPPGPTGWPIFGNLLTIKGRAYTDLFPTWRRRYGSIFTFYLGTKPMTVIGDFHGLHEAYIKRGNDLSSKPQCPSMGVTSFGFRDIRLTPLTDTLMVQRKLVEEVVRDHVSEDSIGLCVHDVIYEATNHVMNSQLHDIKVDIHHVIHEALFKIMHRICFGEENVPGKNNMTPTPKLESLLRNLDSLNENFGKFVEDAYPFLLKLWPTPRFSKHKVDSKVLEDYVYHNYRLTKRNLDFNHPTNLSQKIIAAFKDVDFSFEFTDIHFIKSVCNVFYGGICPTASAMLWAIYVMCAYPRMQDNIYEEVKRVVGTDRPTSTHIPRLVYTRAFLQEVWRLFPPLPLGVPHQALRNTQVRGYDIPKNSLLLVDYYAINRDSRLFTKPLDFLPDRFIHQNGTIGMKPVKGFAPFSIGARKCIGEDLARELGIFTLVEIVRGVKLNFPQGYKADFSRVKDTFYLTPEVFPLETKLRVD